MSDKRAGLIRGNPINGLCERVCVEVTKVFDGCLTRIADLRIVTQIEPQPYPLPYTFLRAASSGQTIISNVAIYPIEGRTARVSFDSRIPFNIFYLDGAGVERTAHSFTDIHREVVLKLPPDSLTAYEIKASSSLISLYGEFLSPTEVEFRCCVIQAVKVTAQVEILLPCYGYCEYPTCNDDQFSCEALSNLPLFPPLL